MKITRRQLKRIIKEELEYLHEQGNKEEAEAEEEADPDEGDESPAAKNKIVKGLALIGVDETKLNELPTSKQQLKAFMDMINRAVDTAVAGNSLRAQKKFAAGTKGME